MTMNVAQNTAASEPGSCLLSPPNRSGLLQRLFLVQPRALRFWQRARPHAISPQRWGARVSRENIAANAGSAPGLDSQHVSSP